LPAWYFSPNPTATILLQDTFCDSLFVSSDSMNEEWPLGIVGRRSDSNFFECSQPGMPDFQTKHPRLGKFGEP
jgi:hypothetical protein